MIKSTVSKECQNNYDENISDHIENGVIMKEELIITDTNNQLDNGNIQNNDIPQLQQTFDVSKLVPNENDVKPIVTDNDDDDDIIIISEQASPVIKKNNNVKKAVQKTPVKTVIIPEILRKMGILKGLMKKGEKVSKSLVYVKKCRLCEKIQKEARSKTMMKCEKCESLCFLFQCLICFKRYTTVNELFGHINKKHASIIQEETKHYEAVSVQPVAGIKVKSNECLPTNERFQLKTKTVAPVPKSINKLSDTLIESHNRSVSEAEETKQTNESPNTSKNLNNIKKNLDVPQPLSEVPSSPLLSCKYCDYKNKSKRYLKSHIVRRHKISYEHIMRLYTCDLCNRSFKYKSYLKGHQTYCGKDRNLECKFCDYKTRHKNTLKSHLQIHLANGDYHKAAAIPSNSADVVDADVQLIDSSSSSLPDTSNVSNNMTKEEKIKLMENTIKAYCKQCNKCTKPNALNKMKTQAICHRCQNKVIYMCKCCGRSDTKYTSLRAHVNRRHIDNSPKACKNCGKLVVSLSSHKRACGLEKRYACEFCDFRTKYLRSYHAHILNKHQEDRKNFLTCDKCNKTFALMKYLRRHQLNYCDNKKSYQCAHCYIRTRSKCNLIRHLQLQHIETINHKVKLDCFKCGADFRTYYEFDKHLEKCNSKP